MKEEQLHNISGYQIDLEKIKSVIDYVLEKEKLIDAYFNVIIVNNQQIREINKNYRKKDKETDVISFALEDHKFSFEGDVRILGDIYVSVEKAELQADSFKIDLIDEIVFLVIHGFYHLLGFDHQTKKEAKIMIAKQEEVLKSYGIKRTT